MKFWDASLHHPASDLAADEALLEACESGGPEILRFWEPREYFVVLGFSNIGKREANLEACRRDGILVLRRCSGGGAVLQGPGCLNYSLILRIDGLHDAQTISSTNKNVMERQRAALAGALSKPVTVEGVSDLCLDGLKFSGNAQRRLRHALIFHGAFLLDFDLEQMEKYLPAPSRQPDYRQQRSHRDFVSNLQIPASAIKRSLQEAWNATDELKEIPDVQQLVREKYSRDEWNLRY